MRLFIQSAAAAAVVLTVTAAAFAQPAAPPAVPDANRDCSQPGKSENLSDKLAQSGGVLCPQNADPDPSMKAPTPPTRDKPVIPPPGSRGGNPNVQPK